MQMAAAVFCSIAVIISFLHSEGIKTHFRLEQVIFASVVCSYVSWSEIRAVLQENQGLSADVGALLSFCSTILSVVCLCSWFERSEIAQNFVLLMLGVASLTASWSSLVYLAMPITDYSLPAVALQVASVVMAAGACAIQTAVMRGAVDRMCGILTEWILALLGFLCAATGLGLVLASENGKFGVAAFDALTATVSLLLLFLYGLKLWLQASLVVVPMNEQEETYTTTNATAMEDYA